jgi:hypothetical protein
VPQNLRNLIWGDWLPWCRAQKLCCRLGAMYPLRGERLADDRSACHSNDHITARRNDWLVCQWKLEGKAPGAIGFDNHQVCSASQLADLLWE